MATTKVVEIVSKVQTILQDTTAVRWPAPELQGWINDSYREIVNLRPDANTLSGEYICTAGARQVLTSTFPSATRLVEVYRNTAVSSALGAVRKVNRQMLDDQRRNWYAETGTVNIQHFMFDARLPKEFLVYPPATTSARLEVQYASVPTPHTLTEAQLINSATTEVIRLDDSYANAMIDYVLYRAYSKDAEYAANASRATAHYQVFQTALGASVQAAAAAQPGVA